MIVGCGCSVHRGQVRGRWDSWWATKVVCYSGCNVYLHLCGWFCVVMGPTRVVGTEWNLPVGDKVRGAEYHGVSEHDLHVHYSANLLDDALPFEVWVIPRVRLLRGGDVDLCIHILAGDERDSDRGDGSSVEVTLVLVKVCGGWWVWECAWDG